MVDRENVDKIAMLAAEQTSISDSNSAEEYLESFCSSHMYCEQPGNWALHFHHRLHLKAFETSYYSV